jgi:hypothetical protein
MALSKEEIQALYRNKAANWQILEAWIEATQPDWFTVYMLAEGLGIHPHTASGLIQSYLHAQRGPNSTTLHVLKRSGRTRAAVWSVGENMAGVRLVCHTGFEDIVVKLRRAISADLVRIAAVNPRVARYAEARIDSTMDGALKVVAAALDQAYEETDNS